MFCQWNPDQQKNMYRTIFWMNIKLELSYQKWPKIFQYEQNAIRKFSFFSIITKPIIRIYFLRCVGRELRNTFKIKIRNKINLKTFKRTKKIRSSKTEEISSTCPMGSNWRGSTTPMTQTLRGSQRSAIPTQKGSLTIMIRNNI